jgi:tRNA G18 (ribose-2'-O)-methylase SpoU
VKNDTRDVVFGLRPVLEALQSGKEIEKIYLHREAKNPVISELVSLASDLKVPILKVLYAMFHLLLMLLLTMLFRILLGREKYLYCLFWIE